MNVRHVSWIANALVSARALCAVAMGGVMPLAGGIVLCSSPSVVLAQGEAPTDGRAIMQSAAEALEAAQSATFDVSLVPDGATLSRAYEASLGQVKALRSALAPGGWLVRVTGNAGAQQVDVAWTDTGVEGVDFEKKVVMERSGQNSPVKGMRLAQIFRMRDVFASQPFKDALAASEYTLEGEQTIAGELCDVVVVPATGTSKKTRWAIARSDKFPRLIEQIFESATMPGKLTITVSNVVIDNSQPPAMAPSEMRVAVPEGFTEDRQVARPAVRPVPGKNAEPAPAPTAQPSEPGPIVDPAPTPEAPAPFAPRGPQAAADFELSTPQGEKVALSSFKGRVVVMQFWGSWCLPCRQWHGELAGAIKTASGEKSGDVSSLAIAVRERDVQNASAELAARNATSDFKLLLNADAVASDYGVSVYPTTVVVDRDGMIAATIVEQGSEGVAQVEAAVRAALGIASSAPGPVASN